MAIQGPPTSRGAFNNWMATQNMDIPGNFITKLALDVFLNNKKPPNPTCKDCEQQTLDRLRYIGPYRDAGLSQGRYTGYDGMLIRTWHDKYNHTFIMNYVNKSVKAAGRALALNNSTHISLNKHKMTNNVRLKAAINELKQCK